MAYALVSNTSAAPGENGGATGAIDTTGANLIVVGVVAFDGAPGTANLSDSKSNAYTELTAREFSSSDLRLFYKENATVGSGHTFTFSRASSFPTILIAAFSGGKASSAFDVQNGASNGSAVTSFQPGSVTPSEDNELLIALLGFGDVAARSIDSSFAITNQHGFGTGNNIGGALAYKIQTSAGAENPTWSWVGNDVAGAAIATFKAEPTGGVSIPIAMRYYLRMMGR
jgi:hypothetical protein